MRTLTDDAAEELKETKEVLEPYRVNYVTGEVFEYQEHMNSYLLCGHLLGRSFDQFIEDYEVER